LAASAGAVVVVAGGGPFADAVRISQQKWKFSDASAHRMAILAMEQFAFLLCGLEPRLQPAASPSAIAHACRSGKTPVWLPARMAFGAAELPESWDVTSDSLALWLADALRIPQAVLVKSARLPRSTASPDLLASRGVVDPFLPSMLSRISVECRAIEAARVSQFATALRAGQLTGTRLTFGR
jgi:5-(aminomethyl)-3-furanmethanol phosphate kinase